MRNVRVIENEGLFADFHFNPKHLFAEQLLWDAENAPENVGFSHNIEAEVVQESDMQIVQKILTVRSVDLVADPATTQGLFESCEQPANQPDVQQHESCNLCCKLIEKLLAETQPDTTPPSTPPQSREQAAAENVTDNAKSFVENIT